jgi:hypothetical protein
MHWEDDFRCISMTFGKCNVILVVFCLWNILEPVSEMRAFFERIVYYSTARLAAEQAETTFPASNVLIGWPFRVHISAMKTRLLNWFNICKFSLYIYQCLFTDVMNRFNIKLWISQFNIKLRISRETGFVSPLWRLLCLSVYGYWPPTYGYACTI